MSVVAGSPQGPGGTGVVIPFAMIIGGAAQGGANIGGFPLPPSLSAAYNGYPFIVTGQTGGQTAGIAFIGYGIGCLFQTWTSGGTSLAPTAVALTMPLNGFFGGGYDGTAWQSAKAGLETLATQTWATGALGTRTTLLSTPIGSAVSQQNLGADSGNVHLGTNRDYGSGVGAVAVGNCSVVPTTNPVGGGVLYVSGGALFWRGPSGTVTPIALG